MTVKRLPPALALFLLAPLVGEYLLGNIPLDVWAPVAFPPTALLYGCGAVLIREVVTRAGGGWLMTLLLAITYGIIEEALVTQSLFNQNYLGLGLGAYGDVPALGISVPWSVYVLSIHSVWSIFVPIVMVETLYADRYGRPWLRARGLVANALGYVVGAVILFSAMYLNEANDGFLLSALQLIGTVVVVAVLIILAFLSRPSRPSRGPGRAAQTSRRAWSPVALGAFALAAGTALFLLFEFGPDRKALSEPATWVLLSVLVTVVLVVIVGNTRAADWSHRHVYALAAGAVLTYCWVGFMVQITQYGFRLIPTIIQILLVAGAVSLIVIASRSVDAFGSAVALGITGESGNTDKLESTVTSGDIGEPSPESVDETE
ncbi:hypothetical protein [Rhizohabitans arisaemae]|uniref:hypothetical protein n=1 Tax=Rhizohabitans arisaemae TaxID=2720610 RepID=UPI0024B11824|nr:hypothetical protein [Rhizohabitans arisaemae]